MQEEIEIVASSMNSLNAEEEKQSNVNVIKVGKVIFYDNKGIFLGCTKIFENLLGTCAASRELPDLTV